MNPNGKIDKPALPFPDTVEAVSSLAAPSTQKLNPSEQAMHSIWRELLPSSPTSIPPDENFFDLGGHSLLATRLIFEVRKAFVVNAPLGLVFERPTIRALSAAIDNLRNVDFGLAKTAEQPTEESKPQDYAADLQSLIDQLPPSFASLPEDFSSKAITVCLTGATGFLGAFILRDLLSRPSRIAKVFCIVRAKDNEEASARVKSSLADRDAWDVEWDGSQRLESIAGDLSIDRFGLDGATWERLANECDAILHNGAMASISFCKVLLFLTTLIRSIGCIPTTSLRPQMLPLR